MIISASRRTDIPAFYSDWFFNRIKAGFVDVRNPMNIHRISRVKLTPEAVDCIVFWSKNPAPMLRRLDELEAYPFYFQFTVNPYDKSLEKFVPSKNELIGTFRALSRKIGSRRVIWRYDPILVSDQITIPYHANYFEELAKRLEGYTSTCVISFIDLYKKTSLHLKNTTVREPDGDEMKELAGLLVPVARKYGIQIQSCAEKTDLSCEGIEPGKCIDDLLIKEITGHALKADKDRNQRKECGCVQSVDIGAYNTCVHHCLYCYANYNFDRTVRNYSGHDKNSSLLTGHIGADDVIKERPVYSSKDSGHLPF